MAHFRNTPLLPDYWQTEQVPALMQTLEATLTGSEAAPLTPFIVPVTFKV